MLCTPTVHLIIQVLSAIQQSNEILNLQVSRQATVWSQDSLPPGTTFTVTLQKKRGPLGLRLAGGKDKPTGLGFIYVKSVVDGSAADLQKIQANDILVTVSVGNFPLS